MTEIGGKRLGMQEVGDEARAGRLFVGIPLADSAEFLAQLRSPDFKGREPLRNLIVGALLSRIDRTLLDTNHPVIGFSENSADLLSEKAEGYIEFSDSPIDWNPRYILRDPAGFFRMLDDRPQDFAVDCLNIIPITIVGAIRDVLMQRGHDPRAINTRLTDMVFHGQNTELTLNGSVIKPLAIGDERHLQDDPRNYRAFASHRKGIKGSISFTDRGINTSSLTIDEDVSPGDVLATYSKGMVDRQDSGNGDSQNGIILNNVPANTVGDVIRVYSHRTDVEKRDSTLGGVFNLLLEEAQKKGVGILEFIETGGIGIEVLKVDYVGLYLVLAESLRE